MHFIYFMNNQLLNRLEGLNARFEEVSTLITDPAVIADMKRFVKLNKEYSDLEKILAKRDEYRRVINNIEEAKTILNTENDPDLREMAKMELEDLEPRVEPLEEEIKILLIPADPEDSKNCTVEIRGGTGGDEAAIFAGDLIVCTQNIANKKVGVLRLLRSPKVLQVAIKRLFSTYRAMVVLTEY